MLVQSPEILSQENLYEDLVADEPNLTTPSSDLVWGPGRAACNTLAGDKC